MDEIATKKQFAAIVGVTPGCVSHWLAAGKIGPDALVGVGHRARINVAVATAQLKLRLDPVQHLGAAGRARLDGNGGGDVPDPVEQSIKAERLRQLALSNQRAEDEAAARAGRYTLADEARQAAGRAVARAMTIFESAMPEFATAIMAEKPATQRDAVRTLRATWRTVRLRAAKATGTNAASMPLVIDDGADDHADRQS
jgi:hypothetical protein